VLTLFTGQRRSDVIRLGRQHAKGGKLTFTQHKGRLSRRLCSITSTILAPIASASVVEPPAPDVFVHDPEHRVRRERWNGADVVERLADGRRCGSGGRWLQFHRARLPDSSRSQNGVRVSVGGCETVPRAISVRQSLASANRFPAAKDPLRRRLGLSSTETGSGNSRLSAAGVTDDDAVARPSARWGLPMCRVDAGLKEPAGLLSSACAASARN
jgi:hypothetical protein